MENEIVMKTIIKYIVLGLFVLPRLQADHKATLDSLIQRVSNEEKTVCLHAVDSLGSLGPHAGPAVPALLKALAHEDEEICWRVARSLGAIGKDAQAAVPALENALTNQNATLRAYAIHALVQIGKPSQAAIARIEDATNDDHALVRRAAFRALRVIESPSRTQIMLSALGSEDPASVVAAVSVLSKLGAAAVPGLVKALGNKESRHPAIAVLSELGPDAADAVPAMTLLLRHANPSVRIHTLNAIGKLGIVAQAAMPEVANLLKTEPQVSVQYKAAWVLGQIKGDEIPALKTASQSKDPLLRLISTWAIARRAVGDVAKTSNALSLIIRGLRSNSTPIQEAAAMAFIELGAPPELIMAELQQAVSAGEMQVVDAAIMALVQAGPPALQDIEQALADSQLRDAAIKLITILGPEAESAVPHLVSLLDTLPDSEKKVHRAVVEALGAIGPAAETATMKLAKMMGSSDPHIQKEAAVALGKIGPKAKPSVAELKTVAANGDTELQFRAVWALQQIDPGDEGLRTLALPIIQAAFQSSDDDVRIEAIRAVERLGPSGIASAREQIAELLDDKNEVVRSLAMQVLADFDA